MKLKLGLSKHWHYELYLTSGSTSHIFKGLWSIKNRRLRGSIKNRNRKIPVVIKWLPLKNAYNEYRITRYILQTLNGSRKTNLLLPFRVYTNVDLKDILGAACTAHQTHTIKTINATSDGPRIIRNGTFGAQKSGLAFLFHCMDGDLLNETRSTGFRRKRVDLDGPHNLEKIRSDLEKGLKVLFELKIEHNDLVRRNILFRKSINTKQLKDQYMIRKGFTLSNTLSDTKPNIRYFIADFGSAYIYE